MGGFGDGDSVTRFRTKGTLERDALANLWKHTLSMIPTVYGRLVYLASLRDPNSGVYRHHGLSTAFGREESARALRESHRQTFHQWLRLPLAGKASEFNEYLASLGEDAETVLRGWAENQMYRSQIPDGASRAQRSQFAQEIETLLALIRNARGV
jgi:hypothetical protein